MKNTGFEIKIIGPGSKNRGFEFMCLTLSSLVSRLVPSNLGSDCCFSTPIQDGGGFVKGRPHTFENASFEIEFCKPR